MEKPSKAPLQRENLHLLAQNLKLSQKEWQETFAEAEIYPSKKQWWFFIEKFSLAIGVGFLLAGIIFFLAYNWSDLHKFIKLGLVELLLVFLLLVAIFRKSLDFINQVVLLAIVVSIGLCFTVFGQIYQTGADAYDLFLVWTLAAIPFVLVSRFPSLWMLFLVLINTTLILWSSQVLSYKQDEWVFLLLFLVNALAFLIWEYGKRRLRWQFKQNWFARISLWAACSYITIAAGIGIFGDNAYFAIVALLMAAGFLGAIVFFGYRLHDLLSVSFALISVLVIITCIILKIGDFSTEVLFLSGFFCIGFSTYMAHLFIQTHKKWQQTP